MRRWAGWGLCGWLACSLAACSLGRGPGVEEALRARRLMVPVAGVAPADVPDTFAAPREGGRRVHGAVDIPAPRRTPVVSADDGRVVRLDCNARGGLTLYATDPDERFVYYYAHLDAYRRGLAKGHALRRGQVLGYVGSTGNADRAGPHLHFQVLVRPADGRWWGGEAVDPRPWFARPGEVAAE